MIDLNEIDAQGKIVGIRPERSVALRYRHVEEVSRVEADPFSTCIADLMNYKRAMIQGARVAIAA